MNFVNKITFMVTFLCAAKYTVGQYYDYSYSDYSSDDDGGDGGVDESGFVTPLDFSPIFLGSSYGLVEAAAQNIPKRYHSLFDLGSSESQIVEKGQDFFEGRPAVKKFSDDFGFLPEYNLGSASESSEQPKRYKHKTVEIQTTQATSRSTAISRAPHQFDIKTKHEPKYKKTSPEASASNFKEKTKAADPPSGKNSYYGGYLGDSPRAHEDDDHLGPYRRYGFQGQEDYYAPAASFQALTGYSGSYPYAKLVNIDPKNLRYKRYSGQTNRNRRQGKKSRRNKQQEEDGEDHPYGYHRYRSRPRDFDESESYEQPDFNYFNDKGDNQKQYDYGADEEYGADDYARIKNLSEQQAEEVQKNPENCKKVEKESMTCMVCLNPKTGGNFESCSYVSEPKNNKYAYVKEQKFDSDDPEKKEESTNTESKQAAEKPKDSEREKEREEETKSSPFKEQRSQNQDENKPSSRGGNKFQSNFNNDNHNHNHNNHHNHNRNNRNNRNNNNGNNHNHRQVKRQRPSKNKENDYSHSSNSPKAESTEPIHYSYEPDDDYNNNYDEESDDNDGDNANDNVDYDYSNSPVGFFTNNEEKNNVESVLAEFANKDRSACTKTLKGEMTCFQCTDKNNMKNEECMFVSESAPKSTHLAYKETKEFNTKPENKESGGEGAASNVVTSKPTTGSGDQVALTSIAVTTEVTPELKKNQPIKKFGQDDTSKKSTPATPRDHLSSDKVSSYVISSTAPSKPAVVKRNANNFRGNIKHKHTKRSTDEDEPLLDEIADPAEFAGEESKGAFWAETVPTYDKELGISLPKFMVEKSEDEILFDETLSKGI